MKTTLLQAVRAVRARGSFNSETLASYYEHARLLNSEHDVERMFAAFFPAYAYSQRALHEIICQYLAGWHTVPVAYCEATERYYRNGELRRIYHDERDLGFARARYIHRDLGIPEDYLACEDCRSIYHEDLLEDTPAGMLCEECRDEYSTCSDCGGYFRNDDLTAVDGYLICSDCLDENYTRCERCGEWYGNDDMHAVQEGSVCGSCLDVYVECSVCGEFVRDNNTYYGEDDEYGDNPLCYSCYSHGRETAERSIHDYSHKPAVYSYKRKARKDKPATNVPFLGKERLIGMENENENVKGDVKNRTAAAEINGIGYEMIYCKRDGSLNDGFEMVTNPFTYEFFQKEFKATLKTINHYLSTNGFRSHQTSTCGLHLHMNRRSVSVLTQFKLAMFFGSPANHGFLLRFSRRKDLHYCNLEHMTKAQAKSIAMHCGNSYNRYTALNFTRRTIELRIPRGTLNTNTMTATVQFYVSIVRFCEETSLRDYDKSHKYISWLANETQGNEYRELKNYFMSKSIA